MNCPMSVEQEGDAGSLAHRNRMQLGRLFGMTALDPAETLCESLGITLDKKRNKTGSSSFTYAMSQSARRE